MSRRAADRIYLLLLLALALLAGGFWLLRGRGGSVTVRIGSDQLQHAVAAAFPQTKKTLLYAVTLRDPVGVLPEGSNRVGLRLGVTARLVGMAERRGVIEADGELRYEPATRQFFLDRPALGELRVDGVPDDAASKIRAVLGPLLESDLVKIPVYRLDETDRRQALAGKVLKAVRVRGGAIEATFGLP